MAAKEPKAKETQPNEFVDIERAGAPGQRKN
jgi:hypothetical protein